MQVVRSNFHDNKNSLLKAFGSTKAFFFLDFYTIQNNIKICTKVWRHSVVFLKYVRFIIALFVFIKFFTDI